MTGRLRRFDLPQPIDAGPLDHPALRGLSPRELADLPIPRWRSALDGPGAQPNPPACAGRPPGRRD